VKQLRRIVLLAVVLGIAGWLSWRAWGPHPEDAIVLSGYIEGEDLYLATPIAGSVATLSVTRGDRVAAGAPLFTMDAASLRAERDQASAAVAQARAQIVVAEAKLAKSRASEAGAAAQAENSRADLARYRGAQRANRDSVSRQQVDNALASATAADQQVRAAEGDVGAQIAQIEAARAQVATEQAALADAQAKLDQLTQRAPVAGRVQDTFYQPGEWAAANQPVVSLLPDDKVKLRFFVPEGEVARYRIGDTVRFGCDGCAAGLSAQIRYVSAQPEFTPPIIYSRSSRDRLVFLVEAQPGDPRGLTPGLPVDVEPLP
jgi:HlyD family secretion protein